MTSARAIQNESAYAVGRGPGHARFRNLKENAANTKTIPTFTIRRSKQVTSLLAEHREQLESLAQALLKTETLDGLDAYAAAGVPTSQQQPAIFS